MDSGDAPGTVTICARGRMGLYADDLGVTLRRSASRADRFGWAEISRFADGCAEGERGPVREWVLLIVLHTGREVPVAWAARPDTLEAVREVAGRHAIPAELTGVPMKDGLPPAPGLYQDPGGQPAL